MGERIPNVDEQKVKYNQFVKNGLKYCYICGKIEMLFRKVQMSVRKMKFFILQKKSKDSVYDTETSVFIEILLEVMK